jgi:hypothetical protein
MISLVHASLNLSNMMCREQASPAYAFAGLTHNKTCGGCPDRLQPGSECDEYNLTVPSSNIDYDHDNSGCFHKTCLVCNGSKPFTPPPFSTVYISSDCNHFNIKGDEMIGGNFVLPEFNVQSEVEGVSFILPMGGAILTNGPLIANTYLNISGGALHVRTDVGYEECSIVATNSHRTNLNIHLNLTSEIYSDADAGCGIRLSPNPDSFVASSSGSIHEVFKGSSNHHSFFDIVVANVEGFVRHTAKQDLSLLVLDNEPTLRFNLHPKAAKILNLTRLMNVFGKAYEIEGTCLFIVRFPYVRCRALTHSWCGFCFNSSS